MRSMQVSSLPLDGVSATSIRNFSTSVWTQLYWMARVRLIITDLSGMVSMAVAVFVIVFVVCASNHCAFIDTSDGCYMCLWTFRTFRVVLMMFWIITWRVHRVIRICQWTHFFCLFIFILQPPFPDYLHRSSHIVMAFVCKKFHFPVNPFEKESSKIPSNWIN